MDRSGPARVQHSFDELQGMLRAARWPMGDGRSTRIIVSLPSINLDSTVMTRHRDSLGVLEERSLFWILALRRPWVRVVAVTRRPVDPVAIEYYLSFLPDPQDARARLTLISLDNPSDTRPLAAIVLERADVVQQLRTAIGDDPTAAMVMPFNVTQQEQDLAVSIGAPIYGITHRFAKYGRKTEGRRLFHDVGVACAPGVEDVRSAGDVAAAIRTLRPSGDVVVKLNDSVYGEGNVRLQLGADPHDLPPTYVTDLDRLGGVVETWLDGDEIASPPARRVAEQLAAQGAVGRFGIDFVVVRDPDATWRAYAMELNLREGGTSHPYGTLWLLTEGNFDADTGAFRLGDGGRRVLVASDNVPVTVGTTEAVLAASRAAGTDYDPTTTTGTIFHMFGAVDAERRISAVTIGTSHADAARRHERMTRSINP
jgi:pheganomycin biosynthesis PGM1-like protein